MIRTALLLLATSASLAIAQEPTNSGSGAILRALDKYTGSVVDIEMAAGTLSRFGRLELILTECRYPAGNPSGDAYAGLQVRELGAEGVVFSGWMVASSPALNAMEHPRYDVWVLRCKTT